MASFEQLDVTIQVLEFAALPSDGAEEIVLDLNCIMTQRHNAFCLPGVPCLSGFGICLCVVFMLHLPF